MLPRNEILQKIVDTSGKQQEEFANSLGLKKAAFNNYLKGRRDIPNTLMQSLADIYGINPAIFFSEDAPLYIRDIDTDTVQKITSITSQLNEKNQQQVYNYAEQKLKEQNSIVSLPKKENKINTIAAHRDGNPLTEEELKKDINYINQLFEKHFDE